jgi:glycosyltransferase involved in cell wall biosynthesis
MEKPSKILILISHFLPGLKVGGPVSSIVNQIEILYKEYDLYVLNLNHDLGDRKPYTNITPNEWIKKEKYSVCYVANNLLTIFNINKITNLLDPDIIYINSLLEPKFSISTVIASWFGLLKTNNLIIAPRGELFHESLAFKPLKKKFSLAIVKLLGVYNKMYWHATDDREKAAIVSTMGVDPNRVRTASGITMIIDSLEECTVESSESSDEELRIIYLARISKDKNLEFAIKTLEKVNRKVVYDIYGPIEDKYIWDKCLERIRDLPKNIVVNYKGFLPKAEIAKAMLNYHLFFMPTLSENYGHSIAESLLCGVPVLISDKTPWRNLSEKNLGWDIDLKIENKFVGVIEGFDIESQKKNRKSLVEAAKNYMNFPKLFEDQIALFKFP